MSIKPINTAVLDPASATAEQPTAARKLLLGGGAARIADVAAVSQQGAAGTGASLSGATDSSEISPDGQILGSARVTLQQPSVIRRDKVEAIRAAIASGTYRPDPIEVAAAVARGLRQIS